MPASAASAAKTGSSVHVPVRDVREEDPPGLERAAIDRERLARQQVQRDRIRAERVEHEHVEARRRTSAQAEARIALLDRDLRAAAGRPTGS